MENSGSRAALFLTIPQDGPWKLDVVIQVAGSPLGISALPLVSFNKHTFPPPLEATFGQV